MEVRDILILTVVVLIFLVVGIGIAINAYTARQEIASTEITPTPKKQALPEPQIGDTLGMMLGALGVVLIIISGVGLNFIFRDKGEENPAGAEGNRA